MLDLRIETLCKDGVALIRCYGRIVFGKEAELLCDHLNQILPRFSKCVLNLAGVRQIDAQGLGALLDCYEKARHLGCVLVLASVSQQAYELLRMMRLVDLLTVYPSEEEAIGACCAAA